MAFAEHTTVTPQKSRMEIETLVRKHGASEFGSGFASGKAAVTFKIGGRRVRFEVAIPSREDEAIRDRARKMRGNRASWMPPSDANLARAVDDEERRLWRCLVLAIKAKLETVASGIATFEEEFLAHIVTETGQTVIERIRLAETEGGPRLLGAAE